MIVTWNGSQHTTKTTNTTTTIRRIWNRRFSFLQISFRYKIEIYSSCVVKTNKICKSRRGNSQNFFVAKRKPFTRKLLAKVTEEKNKLLTFVRLSFVTCRLDSGSTPFRCVVVPLIYVFVLQARMAIHTYANVITTTGTKKSAMAA